MKLLQIRYGTSRETYHAQNISFWSVAVGPDRSDEVFQSFGQGRRGWAGKPKPDRHPNPAKPLGVEASQINATAHPSELLPVKLARFALNDRTPPPTSICRQGTRSTFMGC
jgi:hypothetical protein